MKQGRVLINDKICDHAPECSGIEVCSEGALFWDEKEEKVSYNPEICIDCGVCADEDNGGCPVGAIRFAQSDEEYDKIKKEIEEDIRTIEELQVERYGATPIDNPTLIKDFDLLLKIYSDVSVFLVELYSDDTINCMLYSIKVEDIKDAINHPVKYIKIQLDDISDFKHFDINELPSLLVYNQGKFLGKIEGYYGEFKKEDFFEKVRKIINVK